MKDKPKAWRPTSKEGDLLAGAASLLKSRLSRVTNCLCLLLLLTLMLSGCGSSSAHPAISPPPWGYVLSGPSFIGWIQLHYVGDGSRLLGKEMLYYGPCLSNDGVVLRKAELRGVAFPSGLRLKEFALSGGNGTIGVSPSTLVGQVTRRGIRLSAHGPGQKAALASQLFVRERWPNFEAKLHDNLRRWSSGRCALIGGGSE